MTSGSPSFSGELISWQSRSFTWLAVPGLALVLAVPAHAEWENSRSLTLTASSDLPLHLETGVFSDSAMSKVGIQQGKDDAKSITKLDLSRREPSATAMTGAGLRMESGETVRILLENGAGSPLTLVMSKVRALKPDGSTVDLGRFSCQLRGSGKDAALDLSLGTPVDGCTFKEGEDDSLELVYRPGGPMESKAQAGAGAGIGAAAGAGPAPAGNAGAGRYRAYNLFVREMTNSGVRLPPAGMRNLWNQLSPEEKQGYLQRAIELTQPAQGPGAGQP